MPYRSAEPTTELGSVPLTAVQWNIWDATGARLLGQATTQTAFEAWKLASVATPFVECRCSIATKPPARSAPPRPVRAR